MSVPLRHNLRSKVILCPTGTDFCPNRASLVIMNVNPVAFVAPLKSGRLPMNRTAAVSKRTSRSASARGRHLVCLRWSRTGSWPLCASKKVEIKTAHEPNPRSAGLQPAVSPTSSRPGRSEPCGLEIRDAAAIQQTGSLGYQRALRFMSQSMRSYS